MWWSLPLQPSGPHAPCISPQQLASWLNGTGRPLTNLNAVKLSFHLRALYKQRRLAQTFWVYVCNSVPNQRPAGISRHSILCDAGSLQPATRVCASIANAVLNKATTRRDTVYLGSFMCTLSAMRAVGAASNYIRMR
jgi:hypothetical protein